MSRKHIQKYFQKYHIFLSLAMVAFWLYACSTRKVPAGQALLTKNKFEFSDEKLFVNRLEDLVSQKPNSKGAGLYLVPLRLWFYNMANPKYDTILAEYMTYPNSMRNQNLRDSLFVKHGKPEYKGKSLWGNRFLHLFGEPPVILDPIKTKKSEENIRKFFVYRGYWDAQVQSQNKIDSAAKKAQVLYTITHKDPTYIDNYFYDIPYENIKSVYERTINESVVKNKDILDQENLEKEVTRLTNVMRDEGYYTFNRTNDEISFTADTLKNKRKNVPLTLEIRKQDSGTYKKAKIASVNVYVVDNPKDTIGITKEKYKGLNIFKKEGNFKNKTFWSPILVEKGGTYLQKDLDLTRRNLLGLNNFTIINTRPEELRKNNDSILDVTYMLKPLPRYQVKGAFDVHYSQILNFGFSPSVELTARNVFGGAENLGVSFSGIIGTTKNTDNLSSNKIFNAYELSAQTNLTIPRLWLPYVQNILPKRYSPTTVINLGTSVQNNIGLGRINFNAGINYNLNINEKLSHRFTLFNTQFSFTQNKDKYYELFPRDQNVLVDMFALYFDKNPALGVEYQSGKIPTDEVSKMILADTNFQNNLAAEDQKSLVYFKQSMLNKDRQTQDVIISSLMYNFLYNEMGKKEYKNPLSINAKVEFAGNLFSLFNAKDAQVGVIDNPKTIFKIPYSQFVKFDVDFRKYFTFFQNKHTLAFRQFIGIGIPYGNSSQMPFIRSYFNGGSYDIRAWRAFSGLGPADTQIDPLIRSFTMGNIKLTSSVEYRFPMNDMFHGAVFTDAGNIWNLKDNGIGDQFKFNKFLSQMGLGSGLGLRINVAYITLRVDVAYQIYDPNMPEGSRWRFSKIKPLQPTWNFAFGLPF